MKAGRKLTFSSKDFCMTRNNLKMHLNTAYSAVTLPKNIMFALSGVGGKIRLSYFYIFFGTSPNRMKINSDEQDKIIFNLNETQNKPFFFSLQAQPGWID